MARTRNAETENEFCQQAAGWGTDHVGVGRCKLHGGASPVRSGRYSKITRPRIAELIKEHEEDPDPLNILPELAAARAIFTDFLERYDEWREAFLAWHATWQAGFKRPVPEALALGFSAAIDEYENLLREHNVELTEYQTSSLEESRKLVKWLKGEDAPVKPREVLDVSAAMQHVNTISQIVKREQDARADSAISRKDLVRVQQAMASSVGKRIYEAIPDIDSANAVLKAIRSDWLEIRV